MMRRTALLSAASGAVLGAALAYARVRSRSRGRRRSVERAVTIAKPPDEVYRFCRDAANLPRFMERISSAEARADDRVAGTVSLPGRRSAEWEATIVEDRAGELIAWRSRVSGSLGFRPAPAGRGTEVRLTLDVSRSHLLAEALERQAAEDLRRLKRLLETGEIATIDGQPSGERSPLGRILTGRRERSFVR